MWLLLVTAADSAASLGNSLEISTEGYLILGVLLALGIGTFLVSVVNAIRGKEYHNETIDL